MPPIAIVSLIVAGVLTGFAVGHKTGAELIARALRDGEARVIAYQIDTQHCRAVLWQGQRLEETCEGEKK